MIFVQLCPCFMLPVCQKEKVFAFGGQLLMANINF